MCRNLRRSLWCGMKERGRELSGRCHHNDGHLCKDGFWAVKDVSFELKRGDFLGLIGRNGAGKTTLLRMLNGLIKPDRGRIEMRGRVGALIALGAGFNPILTGRENIYVNAAVLGLKKKEIDAKFDEIVEFAELGEFIDSPVQSYSSGMAVRLGFAVATSLEPDILLLDEVLAVGDYGFMKKCLNRIGELRRKGMTIVFVSHNMHAISGFTSKVFVMKYGTHTEYENTAEGVRAYLSLFQKNGDDDIERICSGNQYIKFHNVEIGDKVLQPGDCFSIKVSYNTKIDYLDAEVDIGILTSHHLSNFFQATNKAYEKTINLKKDTTSLFINIKDIRVNNATGNIHINVWSHNREELLFWYRIPVEFLGVDHATGNTFLDVLYEIK
ncbi:MAG: ABC transporter ATP-binding protein [Desulfobacteraceae bacterium]|nr:MAG: ABC transporter ATP-binding protein [Desulfobacteraceae bacterium]